MVSTCCMIPEQQPTLNKKCQNLLVFTGLLYPLFVSNIIVLQLVYFYIFFECQYMALRTWPPFYQGP